MPDFINRFGENGVLSTNHQSEITSLLSAGTFFGALAQAFTADSIGRKGSLTVSPLAPSSSARPGLRMPSYRR